MCLQLGAVSTSTLGEHRWGSGHYISESSGLAYALLMFCLPFFSQERVALFVVPQENDSLVFNYSPAQVTFFNPQSLINRLYGTEY